ncbi:hypothetical protein BBP40_004930 [Aspergillus hancockii]|nr:hypothetical protein BBP40_004930 [Aspergillus hancockii]
MSPPCVEDAPFRYGSGWQRSNGTRRRKDDSRNLDGQVVLGRLDCRKAGLHRASGLGRVRAASVSHSMPPGGARASRWWHGKRDDGAGDSPAAVDRHI